MNPCPCDCHGHGVYGVCDIGGGCGHLHEDTERHCARADRCADRSPERDEAGKHTGEWIPATITTDRGLCAACVRDVEHALNHLTGDVVELTMILGRAGAPGDVLVSTTPELPIPIRVSIEALRAEIDTELQAWAEPVAEALGIDWDTNAMGRTRMGPRVQRAAQLLGRAVDTLIGLAPQEHSAWINGEPAWDHDLDCQDTRSRDGVDAALDFIDLHRRAYAALGRTSLVHRLPTPCPWCDQLTLVRYNGADQVECETCHRHIEEMHYSWFVAVLVREQQRAAA